MCSSHSIHINTIFFCNESNETDFSQEKFWFFIYFSTEKYPKRILSDFRLDLIYSFYSIMAVKCNAFYLLWQLHSFQPSCRFVVMENLSLRKRKNNWSPQRKDFRLCECIKSVFNENICSASTHSLLTATLTKLDPKICIVRVYAQYLKINFIRVSQKKRMDFIGVGSECDRMKKKKYIIPNVVRMRLVCTVSIKIVGEIRNL